MFNLALLIGIYSHIIFLLGLIGVLYKPTIILSTLFFLSIISYLMRKGLNSQNLVDKLINFVKKNKKLELVLLVIISFQGIVNLIGALGPELGFDALWYHLTMPKIYLNLHQIVHIPGSLLYYSDMPKFTEMLYVSALSFGTETIAKLIHFSFGILSLIALYNLSRKFLNKTFSLLTLVVFYGNLVVGWMSTTAYVDLVRTFFELMALWGFVEWLEKENKKWLAISGVMLGFAASAKLLAISSVLIFTTLLILSPMILNQKTKFKDIISNALVYWCLAFFVVLPWFVFSFVHTGNPVYPFFTSIYPVKFNFNLIDPLTLSDPISPLYVIFLPIALFIYRKFKPTLKIIALYSFLAIIIWYLTPQTGGGRFILPYLPALSLISVGVIEVMNKNKLQKTFVALIIFLGCFSIFYRGIANFKYVPVILGLESKSQFLSNNLNFSFGDFYDTDGYFENKIKKDDKVLLYGFHNLYYVNFPFIDSSYVKMGDSFNYVAVQGKNMPQRFKSWNLIYYNGLTDVRFYSIGGMKWEY
ncbi:MAG: glycosyltransferase family 39 protein [Candidatus Levybacteria bacterium]|nr:glycosyltransferase family 39 protein [Candidatus Levybacteria bacterium]